MKNSVELFVAKLRPPVERGEIGGDKIATITAQILEIARAEIVDHGEAGVGVFLLQGQARDWSR